MNLWQWQMHGSLVYCYRTQLVMKSVTYQMCDLERFSYVDLVTFLSTENYLKMYYDFIISSVFYMT